MKKLYLLILLSALLGLHLSSVDILAQSCTQLSLPENAITRLCTQDNQPFLDLDFSPDGKTLASVVNYVRKLVLWDIENKTVKLTINGVNGYYVRYSQMVRRLYVAMLYMTQQLENQSYYFLMERDIEIM